MPTDLMPTDPLAPRRLGEGDTCWRLVRADRGGPDRRRGALLGSRRGTRARAAVPTLIDRLDGLVRKRRDLEIWLLEWDFALLYALERQFFPALRFGDATHRRLHFELDGEHPLGASHHEKLVVIGIAAGTAIARRIARRRLTGDATPTRPS